MAILPWICHSLTRLVLLKCACKSLGIFFFNADSDSVSGGGGGGGGWLKLYISKKISGNVGAAGSGMIQEAG